MIESDFFGLSAVSMGITITILAFYCSHRYAKSSIPFLFLGIAFMAYTMAEFGYYYFEKTGIEPFGTVIDIPYFIYYVFAILHLLITFYVFHIQKMADTIPKRTLYSVFALGLIATYTLFTINNNIDEESYLYGLVFVALSATLVVFSVIAIWKLIDSKLIATAWLLIGSSIGIASFIDIWYYAQEVTTGYDYGQYITMDWAWWATDVMMILGLLWYRRKI